MHEFIIPKLSLEIIRAYAQSEKIYLRGTQYYDEGAVSECIKLNHRVQSCVSGSQLHPYRVCIYYNENGITNSRCTCEYEGHICKHVIATLLECLNNPQNVMQIKSIINSLAALNEEQLRRLFESFINQNPELHHQLSIEIAELKSTESKLHANDPEPYQHAVRSAFKKARSGYFQAFIWNGSEIVDQYLRFIEKIEQFLSHNDSINALVILEAITTEYVGACDNFEDMYDEDGGIAAVIENLFYGLIQTWCKTIASASLSNEDEKRITRQIKDWQKQLKRCKCDFIHEISIDFDPALLELAK